MRGCAIVLAGGRSSRMGRDKALLELEGRTLLRRQLDLLRAAGLKDVRVSARLDADYGGLDCAVVPDRFAEAGPLAGIERGLASATAEWLLVLPVDLPRMTQEFLRRLLPPGDLAQGVVPRHGGRVEPLVATYPAAAHALAEAALRQGNRSVQEFAAQCHRAGLIQYLEVAPEDASVFLNWNSPEDFPESLRG